MPPRGYSHSHEGLFAPRNAESFGYDSDSRGAGATRDEETQRIAAGLEGRIRDDRLRDDVSWLIGLLTKEAIDRRQAHQLWGLVQLGINPQDEAQQQRLLQPAFSGVDMGALVEMLYEYGREQQSSLMLPQKYKSRTISMELGHVDQYGDWGAAHELDEAVRALGSGEALRNHGFRVVSVYDRRHERSRYQFVGHRIYEAGSESDPSFVLQVVRKRPVADFAPIDHRTQGERPIQLVRRSSFLIIDPLLSRRQRRALSGEDGHRAAVDLLEAALEPGARDQQAPILPVNTLYYARVGRAARS